MAETKNDGGPAFPETNYFDEKPIGSYGGMSLRDYFAGQALALTQSRENVMAIAAAGDREGVNDPTIALAAVCYRIADNMLAERRKK